MSVLFCVEQMKQRRNNQCVLCVLFTFENLLWQVWTESLSHYVNEQNIDLFLGLILLLLQRDDNKMRHCCFDNAAVAVVGRFCRHSMSPLCSKRREAQCVQECLV